MEPVQQPQPKPYQTGRWAILGAVLGGFIGLLVGKFAIGLIFGFFIGILIGSAQRKASTSKGERPSGDETKH